MGKRAEQVQAEWSDRIGSTAADLRRAWYRWLARAWIAAGLFFVMVVVGRLTHTPVVALLAVIPGLAWGVCMIMGFQTMRRMRQSICTALGLAGGTRNCEPPRGEDAYLHWCADKGLTPHPYRSPTASWADDADAPTPIGIPEAIADSGAAEHPPT